MKVCKDCGTELDSFDRQLDASSGKWRMHVAPDCRDALKAEVARLQAIINTPELASFSTGAALEAVHQRERWGTEHDAGKAPPDWFWLVGYLAGKALHHTISTAATLANWHASIAGTDTRMRPGIDTPAETETPK